jgi:hypothetical protein
MRAHRHADRNVCNGWADRRPATRDQREISTRIIVRPNSEARRSRNSGEGQPADDHHQSTCDQQWEAQ